LKICYCKKPRIGAHKLILLPASFWTRATKRIRGVRMWSPHELIALSIPRTFRNVSGHVMRLPHDVYIRWASRKIEHQPTLRSMGINTNNEISIVPESSAFYTSPSPFNRRFLGFKADLQICELKRLDSKHRKKALNSATSTRRDEVCCRVFPSVFFRDDSWLE